MFVRGVTTKGNPQANEWITEYKLGYKVADESISYYVEPYNMIKVSCFYLL